MPGSDSTLPPPSEALPQPESLVQASAENDMINMDMAQSESKDAPSLNYDYYEYYYDFASKAPPAASTKLEKVSGTSLGQGLKASSAIYGNQIQGSTQASTKLAQRRRMALIRQKLQQRLALQQQRQQQLLQKQQIINKSFDYGEPNAFSATETNTNLGTHGQGFTGGLGTSGIKDRVSVGFDSGLDTQDYYDVMIEDHSTTNLGNRQGLGASGSLGKNQGKSSLVGNRRFSQGTTDFSDFSDLSGIGGGTTGLGSFGANDYSDLYTDTELAQLGLTTVPKSRNRLQAGSGLRAGAGAGLGAGLGLGQGLNLGVGTSALGGLGAQSLGITSRHGGGYGHNGYGGHGGIIVLKKKKNSDDGGMFGGLSDTFGDLDIDYETFALILGAAGALAAYVLYTVILSNGRRSFSRALIDEGPDFFSQLSDHVWAGLEDFEGKIEKIAGGVDKDENSWLNKLYKQYHGESLAETLEGDTLAEENEDEMALSNDEHESVENRAFRKKRSDEEVVKKEEEDIEAIFNSVESSCSTKFWRCVSNVIEGGLHYTEMPGGLTGAMKKHLMKVVFAGGISNMWDSLMTVPEARKFQKCMAKQTECTEYEILQKALNSEKALPQRVLVVPETIKVEEEPEE